MLCVSCNEKVEGDFCSACGTKQPTQSEPVVFADVVAKKTGKKQASKVQIFALIGLLLVAGGTGYYTFTQNAALQTANAAYNNASDKQTEAESTASSAEDLLSSVQIDLYSARASKESCYYNWYCSSYTYSLWIDKVSNLEDLESQTSDLLASAQAEAQSWADKKDIQSVKADKAKANRNIGFWALVVEGAALIALVVIMLLQRRGKGEPKPKKKKEKASESEAQA